jgi:hypothetical protein
MHDWYIFVPTACGAIAALGCIWRRKWIVGIAIACVATFTLFNNLLLNVAPIPVKWAFFIVGATLITMDSARTYKRYKTSVSM